MENNNKDYLDDLAHIRSMMEKSSKFMSLSGWAGILAGFYAIAGSYVAYSYLNFNPVTLETVASTDQINKLVLLGIVVLILALSSAIVLSRLKADKKGEKVWNVASRNMLLSMSVPLFSGGFLVLILLLQGFIGLILSLTLIFYGLALINASKFTFKEVQFLGLYQIVLGLISAIFLEWSLLLWTLGFGLIHIAYGIYIYFKYEL